jgi:hypothetical protein
MQDTDWNTNAVMPGEGLHVLSTEQAAPMVQRSAVLALRWLLEAHFIRRPRLGGVSRPYAWRLQSDR